MASIRKIKTKKGNKYQVLYDYEDSNGERKQKSAGTFNTETEAKRVKLTFEHKKLMNRFVNPSKETVEEFAERWIPWRAKEMKWEFNYLRSAESNFKNHIIPEIGHIPMQQVTAIDIINMFSNLENKRCGGPKSYNKEEHQIPYLSGSSQQTIYGFVKSMFNAAVDWKVIEQNPVTISKPERDKQTAEDYVIWIPEMISIALTNIKDRQLNLMIQLAGLLTCRNGEVCGLTLDKLSLGDKKAIKIDQTMQRINKEDFERLPKREVFRVFPSKVGDSGSCLVLKTPKTKGSERWLALTDELVSALNRRVQMIEKNKAYYGHEYNDYNLLFCMDNGDPIEPNLLEKRFTKWQKRHGEELGLPFINFHGLRHSAVTFLMYLSGSDAKTVQSISGHASAKMVFDVYNHQILMNQVSLIEKLGKMVYPDRQLSVTQDSESNNLSIEAIMEEIKRNPLLAQQVTLQMKAHEALND